MKLKISSKANSSVSLTMEENVRFPYKKIQEGLARIVVPDLNFFSKNGRIEPAWAPVFYNPRAIPSRDLSVLLLSVCTKACYGNRPIKIIEPLSATGVRGFRYLLEIPNVEEVFLNDKNTLAYKLILLNSELNNVRDRVTVGNEDANLFMARMCKEKGSFDIVDIDPFGSSAPFLDTALKVIKHEGILCLTFTDIAVPYGVYPRACLRKYLAYAIRTPFSFELALRILLGYVCREAAKYDYGIEPLLAFFLDYYIRIFVKIIKRTRSAESSLSKMGYILYCKFCQYRSATKSYPLVRNRLKCPLCGRELVALGPLWCATYVKKELVKAMLEELSNRRYPQKRKEKKLLLKILSELTHIPYHYTVSEISKTFKVSEPSTATVVKMFEGHGYKASLTHFDPKGFKVDADYFTILERLRFGR
ncbi:MAG: tRNA (guanine(10)-N(2))-dimethyltransferase [Thermoprotei archaeon]|nr:MAG: tRNA (guanine(10)-N(2))-dimethyltransferase [Thermoprotei archaeon]